MVTSVICCVAIAMDAVNEDTRLAELARRIGTARRVVVKIGSSLLIESGGNRLDRPWLAALIDDVKGLRDNGQEVVIVSSGAIAMGRGSLGLRSGPLRLEENQAAAAAGQIHLAHAYQETLATRGLPSAQILMTLDDTEERRRYLNARGTVGTLLKLGAVPVVNENDTVATSEIRYGDNDRLAARVAQMIGSDLLVLLSDVERLYTADPGSDVTARPVSVVETITPRIEAMAGESATPHGTGGMITKIAAARIATGAGAHVVLASGRRLNPLRAIADGAPCTWFLPSATPANARKQWIAGTLKPAGALVIDQGAVMALQAGKSLLPAGVVAVEGRFERGDTVTVRADGGAEIARGLSAYSDADAMSIMGLKSGQIETALGYRGRAAMIHRDDLVLTQREAQ